MAGRVNDGDLVEVAPLYSNPSEGDVVLCQVRGRHYLHLVNAERQGRYQIANMRGHVNGWTSRDRVFGILVAVNPDTRRNAPP